MKQSFKIFTFLVCAFWSFMGVGQVDSLLVNEYNVLKNYIEQSKDTVLAIDASKAYYLKAQKEKDSEQELIGLESLSKSLMNAGQMSLAMIYIDRALELSDTLIDNPRRSKILADKGYVQFTNYEYSKAVETYYEALNEAERNDDFLMEQTILNYISLIKNNLEDYEGARKILQNALKRLKKQHYTIDSKEQKTKNHLEVALNANIAKSFIYSSNGDSALIYTRRSFDKIKEVPSDSCNVRILHYLNLESYLLKNEYVLAKKSLDSAKSVCPSPFDNMTFSSPLGQIYIGEKKYRKAVEVLSEIVETLPASHKMQFNIDHYKYLAKAYKGLGEIDSANYYLEKYVQNSTEQVKVEDHVARSFKKQELASFQKELNDMSAQKAQKESLLMYGSIAGGAIILSLFLGLVKTNKKRKENEQKFEALLAKVTAADVPKEIIDTKDEVLEAQSTSEVNPETTQQILEGLKKLEDQNYFLHPACSAHNVAKRIDSS